MITRLRRTGVRLLGVKRAQSDERELGRQECVSTRATLDFSTRGLRDASGSNERHRLHLNVVMLRHRLPNCRGHLFDRTDLSAAFNLLNDNQPLLAADLD